MLSIPFCSLSLSCNKYLHWLDPRQRTHFIVTPQAYKTWVDFCIKLTFIKRNFGQAIYASDLSAFPPQVTDDDESENEIQTGFL